jgi:pimeloyl-ACP methyl ester carboxylesterase
VKAYPTELPVLQSLLPRISTPVQIVTGRRDRVVPLPNAENLHRWLPRNRLDILDAGHFIWEEASEAYAAIVTSWWRGGYVALGS